MKIYGIVLRVLIMFLLYYGYRKTNVNVKKGLYSPQPFLAKVGVVVLAILQKKCDDEHITEIMT